MPGRRRETEIAAGASGFQSTLWTKVYQAKDVASPLRLDALDQLAKTYWRPAYFFLRRRGSSVEEAKDLVQSFFAALVEKDYLQYVRKDRGRFRVFFLTALKHFVSDERDRARAQKRGGGKRGRTFDFRGAEGQYFAEPESQESPERFFDRQWALESLALALKKLQGEELEAGRSQEFDKLRPFLAAEDGKEISYSELARSFGRSEEAVRKRVHRLRARYREILLRQIAETTANSDDAKRELQDLFEALS